MNPKLKKSLKIGTIVFAILGVLACGLVIAAFIASRHSDSSQPPMTEDVAMLDAGFDGTPTRLGLITRWADHSSDQVVLNQYLMQVLAKKPSADGNTVLVLAGWRPLRAELGAKLANNEVDIAKFADGGTLDMLVDKDNAHWYVSAIWLKKVDGNWHAEVTENLPHDFPASADGPKVGFPELSDQHPSFVLGDTYLQPEYYAVIDKKVTNLLSPRLRTDDLDECLMARAQTESSSTDGRREAPASDDDKASSAANEDHDDATANESDDAGDEEGVGPVEYDCARVHGTIKVLPKVSNHFHELEIKLAGQGADRQQHEKRYVLQYSPKDQSYGFGRAKTPQKELLNSPMDDFITSVLNP